MSHPSSENPAARRLILARHGETAFNVERRFRGRADPALTELGRRQACALGEALVGARPCVLLASPRERAIDTARAIGAATNLRATVAPGLDDIDYGEWTGLTPAEVATRWPDAYRAFRNAPEQAEFPGGETMTDFARRVAGLVTTAAEHGVSVFVTHDVVIRVLLCQLLSAPLRAMHRIRIEVASMTSIAFDPEPIVVETNQASHLRAARA